MLRNMLMQQSNEAQTSKIIRYQRVSRLSKKKNRCIKEPVAGEFDACLTNASLQLANGDTPCFEKEHSQES